MAESQVKRLRQETLQQEYSNLDSGSVSLSKRLKPLNNILSFLEEEEEDEPEPSHDLSAIYTTLQRELSTAEESEPPQDHHQTTADLDEGVESVMRHLLEASDDELGIPKTGDDDKIVDVSSDENVTLLGFTDHGLWDIEDEDYSFLESELFM